MTDNRSNVSKLKVEGDFHSIVKDESKGSPSPISPALDANSPNPLQAHHASRESNLQGVEPD